MSVDTNKEVDAAKSVGEEANNNNNNNNNW